MKAIQVFDPALCCSTGVCGVDVDQQLVTFSADVDWLRKQGVTVERFNLAQQPQAFATDVAIRNLLETQGVPALPAVVVEGNIKLSGCYPSRDQLAEWAGISVVAASTAQPRSGCCSPTTGKTASTASKCC